MKRPNNRVDGERQRQVKEDTPHLASKGETSKKPRYLVKRKLKGKAKSVKS